MSILDKLNELKIADFVSVKYEPHIGNVCVEITADLFSKEFESKVVKVLSDNRELLRMEANLIHKMEVDSNVFKDNYFVYFSINSLMCGFGKQANPRWFEAQVDFQNHIAEICANSVEEEPSKECNHPPEMNDFCPDCKDGFYYPLAGPPEPCRTCK